MALGFKANEIDENVLNSLINSSLTNLKDLLYPVGCIVQTTAYSTVSEMREAYGGNDWELITNRVLMGAGDTYSVGETGGSDSVTLSTANLPSHNHTYSKFSGLSSHKLTISEMPSHSHGGSTGSEQYNKTLSDGGTNWGVTYLCSSSSASNGQGIGRQTTEGEPYAMATADLYATHTHSISSQGGNGTHTHNYSTTLTTTSDTGSDNSFDIVNPYYAIYIWTRTA